MLCCPAAEVSPAPVVLITLLQSTQDLLQRMCADLFQERPKDAVQYLMNWLEAEQQRREEKQQEAVKAANA